MWSYFTSVVQHTDAGAVFLRCKYLEMKPLNASVGRRPEGLNWMIQSVTHHFDATNALIILIHLIYCCTLFILSLYTFFYN